MEEEFKTILIVEDDAGLSELLAERIEENGYKTICMLDPNDAIDWLAKHTPFLMSLDYSLPGMNGEEFIHALRKKKMHIPPFIVSTGQGDERVAVEMMKLGAKDYIIKDRNLLDMILLVIRKVSREVENEHKLKQAEQALNESYQFNNQIIRSAQEGIVVYDQDLNYKVWNPFMENLTGIPSSEIIGKNPLNQSSFLKNTATIGNLEKALKGESFQEVDLPFNIPSSGKSGWLSNSTAPLFNTSNQIVGAITTVRDITERKCNEEILMENEILLKELNADKDKFISILAHDLKNPFVTILGFLEILQERVREFDIDTIEDHINIINNSVENTFKLLEDILLWARTQSGKIQFTPLELKFPEICNNVYNALKATADSKNITISFAERGELSLFADPEMLKIILRNLISNAIKFSNNGGKIIITAENQSSEIIISVLDNGTGMKPNVLARLFDLAQVRSTEGTANEKGTGLGLLICKDFVDTHGGRIWAESKEGEGSTFYFALPCAKRDRV